MRKRPSASMSKDFISFPLFNGCRQTSNIIRTLLSNTNLVTVSTTSSFWTLHLASIICAKAIARRDKKHLACGIWWVLYLIFLFKIGRTMHFNNSMMWYEYRYCRGPKKTNPRGLTLSTYYAFCLTAYYEYTIYLISRPRKLQMYCILVLVA